jgi:hypothetical protein
VGIGKVLGSWKGEAEGIQGGWCGGWAGVGKEWPAWILEFPAIVKKKKKK